MNTPHRDLPELHFLTSPEVTPAERAAAEEAVRAALADVPGTVDSAQVTLSVLADPDLPRPALARAAIVLNGHRLRAQAAAPTLPEAIDLLRNRLTLRASYLRAS